MLRNKISGKKRKQLKFELKNLLSMEQNEDVVFRIKTIKSRLSEQEEVPEETIYTYKKPTFEYLSKMLSDFAKTVSTITIPDPEIADSPPTQSSWVSHGDGLYTMWGGPSTDKVEPAILSQQDADEILKRNQDLSTTQDDSPSLEKKSTRKVKILKTKTTPSGEISKEPTRQSRWMSYENYQLYQTILTDG